MDQDTCSQIMARHFFLGIPTHSAMTYIKEWPLSYAHLFRYSAPTTSTPLKVLLSAFVFHSTFTFAVPHDISETTPLDITSYFRQN